MPEPSPASKETPAWQLPSPELVLQSLGVAYVFLALVLLGRWLLGHVLLWRFLWKAQPAPENVAAVLAQVVAERGGVRSPRLLVSRQLRVPVSCGLLRPTVILPVELCDDPGVLRWVFAHELTHLERRDPWTCLLFGLGQIVYFYLPWFWSLRRQVGLCQELIADAAVARQEAAPEEYAAFLLRLTTAAVPAGATGVVGRPSDLFRRVSRLLQPAAPVESRCPRRWSWAAAAVLLPLAVALAGAGPQAATTEAAVPTTDPTSHAADTLPMQPESLPLARSEPANPSPPEAKVPSHFPANGGGETRLGVRTGRPGAALVDQLNLPADQGLVVEAVLRNSPADRAGLRPHDILLTLDGKPIPSDSRALAALVQESRGNAAVDVLLVRKGAREVIHGLAIPPAHEEPLPAGVGSIKTALRIGDRFTACEQEGAVFIAMSGTVAGQLQVEEVWVQREGSVSRYTSLNQVPSGERDRVQALLEMIAHSPAPVASRVGLQARESK
jgi:beta-lactamase regulating signal transducer with metallopeptidase domain